MGTVTEEGGLSHRRACSCLPPGMWWGWRGAALPPHPGEGTERVPILREGADSSSSKVGPGEGPPAIHRPAMGSMPERHP